MEGAMNSRKGAWKIFFTALLLALSLLGSCALDAPEIEETKVPAQSEQAQLPNPASEHCAEQGGTLEIRMEVGGEVGYCQFRRRQRMRGMGPHAR
jgi:putative hemolysin